MMLLSVFSSFPPATLNLQIDIYLLLLAAICRRIENARLSNCHEPPLLLHIGRTHTLDCSFQSALG